MYTYEIKMDHVNGLVNNLTLHIEALNKLEAADKVNQRFGYPQTISYSMHEIDRPLSAWEKLMNSIDQDIIAQRKFTSFLRELNNSFSC